MANIGKKYVSLPMIKNISPTSWIQLMNNCESQEAIIYHPNQSFTFFPNVRSDVRDWLEHECKWKFAIMGEEEDPGFMRFRLQLRYITTASGAILERESTPRLDLASKDIKRTIVFQDTRGAVEFKLRFVE